MAHVSVIPAAPAIPAQIGRYNIVCELGQGGMGTIYLGRAEGIGGFERLMAIKMIHPHLSKQQSFINMFLDEARIAALIRHPNVVPVYEIGEHFGRHFLAMDYVSGEPLSILLDNTWCRGVALDFDLIAYIVSVVCDALHAAHELQDSTGRHLRVVHRDVCPQNIMLGYDGITRVMDFGVAKAVDQLSQTRPGTHKGKVPYMAPEQIRCQNVDRRSDIFSLGVVLWESTIGKRLFKGENDILSASKVLKGRIPRPTKARPGFPQELEDIVLQALNPSPDRRFATARDMAYALREYLAKRAAIVSASNVERLLEEVCKDRKSRRREMERRLASRPADAAPVDENTMQLTAGESNLPSFDPRAVLQQSETAKDALLSVATAREVFEFGEETSDSTVRTELEELGFLPTAEFDLLDNEEEAPPTTVEHLSIPEGFFDDVETGDVDARRLVPDAVRPRSDDSTVRELVAHSDHALRRDPKVEAIVDPAESPIEVEPVAPFPRRRLVLAAVGLAAVVAIALALAGGEQPSPVETHAKVDPPAAIEAVDPLAIDPPEPPPPRVDPPPARVDPPVSGDPPPRVPPVRPEDEPKRSRKTSKRREVPNAARAEAPIDKAQAPLDKPRTPVDKPKAARDAKPKLEKDTKPKGRLLVDPGDL